VLLDGNPNVALITPLSLGLLWVLLLKLAQNYITFRLWEEDIVLIVLAIHL
jgi:hypothetical protein